MNSKTITESQLCSLFDHTNLHPDATRQDFQQLCKEAADGHFAMVAINPTPVALCKSLLRGTGVHVGAAIGFPLGQTTQAVKLFETRDAIENGADEIDYVINVARLKDGDTAYIRGEMQSITSLCRQSGVLCKVIFENCYLTRDEIILLAELAKEIQPDFIKTSTGFGPGGAKEEDVRLMHRHAGEGVQVKAAGGIRSWAACAQMIDAGATRIGTSSSFVILEEFRAERKAGADA